MELPQFQRDPSCKKCSLHEATSNVCLPTCLAGQTPEADTVILAVGAKPGVEEERTGTSFVGEAGRFFHGVYRRYVDDRLPRNKPVAWAVTNAVRCCPPKDATVTQTMVKACHDYLVDDIQRLGRSYKEVVLLLMGEPAVRSILGTAWTPALRDQGRTVDVGGVTCRVFVTANPFVLAIDPAVIHYVRDHLQLVVDYVTHGKIPMSFEVPVAGDGEFDALPGTPVGFDTETYGSVEGFPEQTVFHPARMVGVDGADPGGLVVTAAVAWLSADGMKTQAWNLEDPGQDQLFRIFMRDVVAKGHPLVGMNVPFDVKVLRATGHTWLDRSVVLHDVAIANFLNSDKRPERSLKEIAPLLRIVQYDEKVSLKNGYRYPSANHSDLLRYCVQDAAATLEAWVRLRDQTRLQHPGTARFSPRCLEWYSDVLWSVVDLDEAGVAFSRDRLQRLQDILERRMQGADLLVQTRWGVCYHGDGSKKHVQELFDGAAQAAGVLGDERLVLTEKTKQVSTNKENVHFLIGKLPLDSEWSRKMRALRGYKRAEKLRNSFTNTLLNVPAEGLVGDMAWPTWYSVPSRVKDEGGNVGGTKQGRLTCKSPALQTMPSIVKECMTTRFSPGVLIGFDLSQIELRVAALLSGDPAMCWAYEEDTRLRATGGQFDRHGQTAELIFGGDARSRPDWKKLRHVGKTLNFLTLFRGGAETFQSTLRRDQGMEMPLHECKAILAKFDKAYATLRRWQDQLILQVSRQGYYELPITGETRTFVKGPKAKEKYTPDICNFPVQTLAANVLKSAQRLLQDQFRAAGLKALIVLNIYDAIYVDCPAHEEGTVRQLVGEVLPCPPFYRELQSYVGRAVPLAYEAEVVARRP